MDDAGEGSRATRRQVLEATAGALAVGALPGHSSAQQASGPTVYVGSQDNTLYAVDAATGEEEWAFTQPSGGVESSPTVVDGTVYVGSDDSTLYAVDAATGNEEWAFTQPSWDVNSSPTVADGTVYVGSDDGNLYAVDADSGTEEWAFTQPSGPVFSSPTVVDGTVYVGSDDSTLYAVDGATGSQEWAFTQPSPGVVESSPTVVDGTVYVGSGLGDETLYAVDAATGNEEWAFTQPSGPVYSSPTVADGTVYVGSDDGNLYAVDADSGEEEWAFTQPSSDVSSPPMVYEGTVYVGSLEYDDENLSGTLYAVDAATGSQEWSFTQPSDGVDSSPTVADGTVYVGSWDDTLYAVDADSGEEEWAFTQPSDSVHSSPTVVADPESGDSVGSRVMLGTLGHHGNWRYAGQSIDVQQWGVQAPELPTLGGTGLVTLAGVYGLLNPSRLDGQSDQDLSRTEKVQRHPGMALSVAGLLLSVVAMTLLTPVGAYTVGWLWGFEGLDTNYLVFTALSNGLSLDFVLAAVTLLGWALVPVGLCLESRRGKRLLPVVPRVSQTTVAGSLPIWYSLLGVLWLVGFVTVGQPYVLAVSIPALLVLTAVAHRSLMSKLSAIRSSVPLPGRDTFAGLMPRSGTSSDGSAEGQQPSRGRDDSVTPDTSQMLDQHTGDSTRDTTPSTTEGPTSDTPTSRQSTGQRSTTGSSSPTPEGGTTNRQRGQMSDAGQSSGTGRGATRQQNSSAARRVPLQIPDTPRPSLTYEDITVGDPLGRGGNADVYHATAATPQGEIELAVKEPRMGGGETLDTRVVERMMDEAETWEQLDGHDHVAGVVDYGTKPLPWIAMEYMDGGHLGERADEMGTTQKLWTALSVTEGVYHAHNRGIAHRDLKPENILFRRVDGAWGVPKVADWGLSKHLLEHSKSRDGMTVEYAAPEQFSDSRSTDDRTDIYQLGAVFYELFTGQPPFEGEMFAVMKQIENERPTPPSESADVPDGLDEILLRALAKEPDDRYSDIVYLRDDLQELFDQP